MRDIPNMKIIIAVIILAITGVGCSGQNAPRVAPKERATGTDVSATPHKSNETQENCSPTYNFTFGKGATGEESQYENKQAEKHAHAETLLTWFTGFLALVAGMQFFALIWQVMSTRTASRTELRAYVFPKSITRYNDQGVWKFRAIYENSGKTPAHDFKHWIMEGISPLKNPPNPSNIPTEKSEGFIGPGNTIESVEDALLVSKTDEAAIETGKTFFFVIGELNYRDVFDRLQKTYFRFIWQGTKFDSGIFVFCGTDSKAT